MRHGAILAQLQIPPVVLGLHAQLLDARLQHVQPLLTLAAAAELAHAGHQQVGCGHGLAVLVGAHVECLDLLRIVGDEHRLAEVLLRQVALVLGLQVAAPVHGILELRAAVFQNLHGLGVADTGEVRIAHGGQALDQALVHEAVQEVQLLRGLLQHSGDDVLDHVLFQLHVIGQVGEGDLRLDHPELRRMARGVAVLGAEGRAEGVHVAECQREDLRVQLAGHGQGHVLAEEVLRKVHLAVLGFGQVVHVQRGQLEHLARALAVAAGDQRRVHIQEAAVVEEPVNRLRRQRADPERALEQVGARAQVLNRAQVLQRVALLLQRIVAGALAHHGQRLGLQLEGLLHLRGQLQRAGDADGRAHGDLAHDLLVIGQPVGLHHHLQVAEVGAVVQLDERERLALALGAHPALQRRLLDVLLRQLREQLLNRIFCQGNPHFPSDCFFHYIA